jgi:D-serine deaminase-like pyridoxal phosphate-dependent protein
MKGLPAVANRPGLEAERVDSDHIIFRVSEGEGLKIGDQVALIPGQQDAMVSRWDRFIGVRNGRVEAVWDIQARGCHS